MTTNNLSHLNHAVVRDNKNSEGTFVLVLDTGAVITSEDRAMLQAWYSRSPDCVLSHLGKLEDAGSGKFMDVFYVGYGHKSIGDCGDTTIFIEGVSMLAAKAVQDDEQYDGQEVSTRYLDFSVQPFVNPLGLCVDENPQEWLRQFYVEAQPVLRQYLKEQYPIADGEKDAVYEKAINARGFDILRGYLPAGAQTNLAWTSSLRHAADRIALLRAHPLEEVRNVAEMSEVGLKKMHPHSFNQKRYEASESYRQQVLATGYYFDNDKICTYAPVLCRDDIDYNLLHENQVAFETRPEKTELPRFLAEIGTLQFGFLLDFGSYRDVQRHRAVIQRMPLLSVSHGFHEWYLKQLPDELRMKAVDLLMRIEDWYAQQGALGVDPLLLQYYVAMGYMVPCRITGDLPALVYLVELRSGPMVHATLRYAAQLMGGTLQELGVKVYIDMSDSGRFDTKRGTQDITQKSTI